jgi:hypothetical protein
MSLSLGLAWNYDLLIFASQAARIIGLRHHARPKILTRPEVFLLRWFTLILSGI